MSNLIVPMTDKGYYLNFTIEDSTGTAYNISTYTIKLKVWNTSNPGTLLVNGTCNLVGDGSAGTCRYLVTTSDFTIKGTYSAELELTKTDVIESTTSFTIEVKESG